jgi:hypothetical protein
MDSNRGSSRLCARPSRLHDIKVAIGSTVGDTVNLAGGIKPGTCIAEDLPSEAMGRKLVRPVMMQKTR